MRSDLLSLLVLSFLRVVVAVAAGVCELENDIKYGYHLPALVMLFHEYFMCLAPIERERERENYLHNSCRIHNQTVLEIYLYYYVRNFPYLESSI